MDTREHTGQQADEPGMSRPQSRQQKILVGGVTLALVGGVTLGAIQLFGSPHGTTPGGAAVSDSAYCGALGPVSTLIGVEGEETLVSVISPVDGSDTVIEPERSLEHGDRLHLTDLRELGLQLFNSTDETFVGTDVSMDIYVMSEGRVIAAPPLESTVEPTPSVIIAPGGTAAIPMNPPGPCPNESFESDKNYSVYAVAVAHHDGDGAVSNWLGTFGQVNHVGFAFDGPEPPDLADMDPEALQMWGGPWIVGPLDDWLANSPEQTTEPTAETPPIPTPTNDPDPAAILVESIEAQGHTRVEGSCRSYDSSGVEQTDLPCPINVWTALDGKSVSPSQLADEVFYFSLADGVDALEVDAETFAWLNIGVGTGGDGMIAPRLTLDLAALQPLHHGVAYPATIDSDGTGWQRVQPLVFGDQITTIEFDYGSIRIAGADYVSLASGSQISMWPEVVSFHVLQENPGWESAGVPLETTCQPYERQNDLSATFANDTVDCPVDFIIPSDLTEQPQTLDSLRNLIGGLRLRDDADPLRLLILERVEVTILSDGEPVPPPIIGDFDTLPIHQRVFKFDAENPFGEIGTYREFLTTDSGSLPDGELTVTFALNLEQIHTNITADGDFDSTSLRLTTAPIRIQATH